MKQVPIKPTRQIAGMSAVLLPHDPEGAACWDDFEAHVSRTFTAGLTPAVNMDTGFVQLLRPDSVRQALDIAASITGGDFLAGAYVADEPGAAFDIRAYVTAATAVAQRGGTPVIFPSHGLNSFDDDAWVQAHRDLAADLDRFVAFELGDMFVPYGRIYSTDAYEGLLGISACVGAKHSSLSRAAEWSRLVLRDRVRPDFKVLTGNDLAIDMVMWGSDYLLGLSTFAPDLFAERDRLWARGDDAFFELNDLLQYLGQFAFRRPVPAYRHDAAIFLQLRGWIGSDAVPDGAPRRPDTDREVLRDIAERLGVLA